MSRMSGIFYKNHKWWNYFPVFRRHSQGVGLFSLFLTGFFFSSNLFVVPCKKHTAADLHVPASPWKQRPPVTWHRGAAVIGWQLRVFWPLFFKASFAQPVPPSPRRGEEPPSTPMTSSWHWYVIVATSSCSMQEHRRVTAPSDRLSPPARLEARLTRRRNRSRLLMLRFAAFGLLIC